jgi:starvation-inducible DNA-binding protein
MKGSGMDNNRSAIHNNKLLVDIQPNIGLDSDIRVAVIGLLNTILADEAVLIIKTHAAFWNWRGVDTDEYQQFYKNQFQTLNEISDEIVERIKVMGGFTIGSMTDFLKQTRIEEQPGTIPNNLRLLADQEMHTRNLRADVRKCADEYEDDVTSELLVHILYLHEKMAWRLRTLVQPLPSDAE